MIYRVRIEIGKILRAGLLLLAAVSMTSTANIDVRMQTDLGGIDLVLPAMQI